MSRVTTSVIYASAGLLALSWSVGGTPRPVLAATFRLTDSTAARRSVLADSASTVEFMVDGLRVVLRRNPANDVVAANVYFLGGTQQVTPATAGIEPFLLAASDRGTRHYPRALLRRRLAELGSTIVVEPTKDWTLFGLRAIRSAFDSTWMVLADRIMTPTLDSAQVELVRTQLLGSLREQRSQPDEELTYLANSLLYGNHHPYALSSEGTAASVARIAVATLRGYHDHQFVKSRMLLVVVGNVDREHVERLIAATLARLPAGNYAWKAPAVVEATTRALAVEQRPLPTNYILGYYPGPPATSPDYPALRIASAVLSGRFFTEIRSKRNLSYAVDAPFIEQAIATGGVYVTTVSPDVTLELMCDEIDRLQVETIDRQALQRLVQQFITDYFLKNETNGDQANFLARAAVYGGDYRVANRFIEGLRRVTPEDVRTVANRYMHDYRFAYVGDTAKVPRAVMRRF